MWMSTRWRLTSTPEFPCGCGVLRSGARSVDLPGGVPAWLRARPQPEPCSASIVRAGLCSFSGSRSRHHAGGSSGCVVARSNRPRAATEKGTMRQGLIAVKARWIGMATASMRGAGIRPSAPSPMANSATAVSTAAARQARRKASLRSRTARAGRRGTGKNPDFRLPPGRHCRQYYPGLHGHS